MSNTQLPLSISKTQCGAALAAAVVAGAGLFFEPTALAPEQQAALERMLAQAGTHLVAEASSCCLPTAPQRS
jgi:hypothetical protein